MTPEYITGAIELFTWFPLKLLKLQTPLQQCGFLSRLSKAGCDEGNLYSLRHYELNKTFNLSNETSNTIVQRYSLSINDWAGRLHYFSVINFPEQCLKCEMSPADKVLNI